MRAILIILVLVASLGWIGYAGFSLIEKEKHAYHPEFVLNEEDSAVLIINRWQELNQPQEVLIQEKNQYLSLHFPQAVEGCKFYFSAQRSLVILEKDGVWSDEEINQLIKDLNLDEKEVFYSKGTFVVLSKTNIQFNATKENFLGLTDKNASANLVEIAKQSNTDIYKTSDGNYQYRSKIDNQALGKAVDDQLNFAYIVPEDVEDYSFYQYAFLAENDSVYAQSLMAEWIDKGIIRGKLKGKDFLISDYLPQQNPILILFENSEKVDTNYLVQEAKHFSNFQLLQDFPKGNSIYVLAVEDKVVIAESEAICNQVALHYKLGKTLALNPYKKNNVFGGLTKDVHYRSVKDKQATALSYSEKQSFRVQKLEDGATLALPQKSEVLTVSFVEKPISITPIWDHIREGYSFFVAAKKGYYALVSAQGKVVWKGNLSEDITHAEVVDVYQNKKFQIAYSTAHSFGILDLNGNSVNGFPVAMEAEISTKFSAVAWRGESKYILGTAQGEVIMLNAKGMELMIQKPTSEPLIGNVFGLNRKGTLSAWVQTEQEAFCVELEKTKIKSKANNFGVVAQKAGSDVIGGVLEGDNLVLKNIAGEEIARLKAEKAWTDQNFLYTLSEGVLHVNSLYGDEEMTVNKSNQEISLVHAFKLDGSLYTLILDRLENNVYLFNNKGNLVKNWPKEGERIISYVVDDKKKELIVYSTVDQNLIAYSYRLK